MIKLQSHLTGMAIVQFVNKKHFEKLKMNKKNWLVYKNKTMSEYAYATTKHEVEQTKKQECQIEGNEICL